MCVECHRAVLLLRKKARMTSREAHDFLWSWTPFPFASALDCVLAYLRVRRGARRRWLRKQDARRDRSIRAAAEAT
jgi:hypothetical protein